MQTASLYHLRRITGSVGLQMGTMGTMISRMRMRVHGTAEPTQEDEGEESLPVRQPGVSFQDGERHGSF